MKYSIDELPTEEFDYVYKYIENSTKININELIKKDNYRLVLLALINTNFYYFERLSKNIDKNALQKLTSIGLKWWMLNYKLCDFEYFSLH